MDRFTRAVEERDRRDWEHDHGGAEGDLRAALTELRAIVTETLKRVTELLRQLTEARHEAQEQRERAELAERRLAALTTGVAGKRWHVSGRGASVGLCLFSGAEDQDFANDRHAHATAEAAADAIIAVQAAQQQGGGQQ